METTGISVTLGHPDELGAPLLLTVLWLELLISLWQLTALSRTPVPDASDQESELRFASGVLGVSVALLTAVSSSLSFRRRNFKSNLRCSLQSA